MKQSIRCVDDQAYCRCIATCKLHRDITDALAFSELSLLCITKCKLNENNSYKNGHFNALRARISS